MTVSLVNRYDPENWLNTTLRACAEYTELRFQDINGIGSPQLYNIVTEFPSVVGPSMGTAVRQQLVPLDKITVHFEVDEIVERKLGLGNNEFADNIDGGGVIYPQEAGIVLINLDVGIWTSDKCGGTTARADTRTLLSQTWGGVQAIKQFREQTDSGDGGIEIVGFSGGRFVTDKINDVPVYRTVDANLNLKVFSRTPKPLDGTQTIDEILQSPGLTILG